MTSESLHNYYRDEMNDAANEDAANYRVSNNKITTSKYFEYKTKIAGKTPANNNNRLNIEVAIPLKYLSNFWRSLDLSLINYEIEYDLSWSKKCVISEKSRTPEVGGPNQWMQHTHIVQNVK